MKNLNIIIKKLTDKVKRSFAIETIMKKKKIQSIFNSIIIIALAIFSLFTIISYNILKYSYSNQNEIYEDGYLASSYANKINEDVLNIRIYYLLYSITYDKSITEKLKACGKDIDDSVDKYKLLHNLTDEENNIIGELTKSNNNYRDEVKKMIDNISEAKTIQNNQIGEMLFGIDTKIELSKNLINYSSNRINMLNDENKKIKSMVMHTIIIINFLIITLFILMIFIVKRISEKAEYYAFYSSITGLPNKNYVVNTLANDISKLNKDKYTILISLDMDNFKGVNETLGYNSGDKFLKQVGKRLRRVINIQDDVYHIGADEFLFLIRSVNNKAEAEVMVKRIQNVFKDSFYVEGKEIDYVTASLGAVVINKDVNDFENLYNCADDAMYESKRLGKNRYRFYDQEMYSSIYEKTVKKKAIQEGIEKGEFKVFYQPKVSDEEKFLGAEALVRWIKEDNKIIPPSEFIEFAENEGLIKYIGEVVIIEVCKKISEWIEKGYKNFRIAINLAAEQLINEELCDKALNIIKEFKIPFEYIEFEVTESTIIKDLDVAIKSIEKIKSYGIKVSLDDFGTGYSSLNYLKKLSVNSVKIDKSFIDTLVFDDASNVMVNTIIKMCHYFGYEVVAEGVEKRNQIECLKDLDCDIFQGYYFGKPMNSINFENEFLI